MPRERSDHAVLILLFLRLSTSWQLTDDEMAALAAVRPSTIARWRTNDHGRPSDETLKRIDLVLEIELRGRALLRNTATWLRTAPIGTGNTSPLVLMMRDGDAGLLRVRTELLRLTHPPVSKR